MKREFLLNFKVGEEPLPKEVIDAIMDENGRDIERAKTNAVNDIPGVAGVVDLKKGIVTVSYEQEVADDQIKAKIERVGYTVTEIR